MIQWTVKHATTVMLTVFAIAIFGSSSYCSLPREASPDITIPVVMITTAYPGASPADIEGLVTNPMENELAGLRNVKEMTSVSSEGLSLVSIEFETDVVIEDALQRTRDRVNRARRDLPDDVEQSDVREISFSDIPVLLVTIAGQADQEILKDLAEEIEDDVKRIPGVLSTGLSGGLERELKVLIDPGRLNYYGFSFNDVLGALQSENVNIPGGAVSREGGDVMLRVPQTFKTAQDIEQVAVKRVGGQPVFIRDLGRVTDGFAPRMSYARMNAEPAVTLSVTKRAGANIIDVSDAIKATVATQSEAWPDGIEYRILADQSINIRNMITELQNNIFTALLLVVGVLLFFMGTRNSLFVALAIPLSMLISFGILQALGFTLNMVVLFSLILALGMLVDNAIVVVENIYRHLELGYSRIDAAIKGTREVAVAIAASTATTVAAFFPMVFWGGIMGEFMGYLPKTVIIVLISSLFVAICILPVATSRLMRTVDTDQTGQASESNTAREGSLRWRIMNGYKTLLTASIRYRYVSAGMGVAALIGTFIIYGSLNHGTELFPSVEPNRAVINLRAPVGTELDWTDQVTRRIETHLAKHPNVDVWTAESGVSGDAFVGSSNSANEARITVDFLPHATMAQPDETPRVESTFDTIQTLREQVSDIPGVEISVEKEEMGPPVGADIEVVVIGPEFHAVGKYIQRFKRDLANIEGVTEIADDYRVNRPELALRTDRGAAKRIGVSSGVIGNTIRTAIAGTKATTVRERDRETDVVVQLAPEFRDDVQSILSLRLPGREDTSPDTFPVPISAVASYEMAGGTGSIRHIDQDLAVSITADVPDGYNINAVQQAVANRLELYKTGEVHADEQASYDASEIAELTLPNGFHVKMAGSTDEQKETEAFLSWAFLIAIALITIILVTQFDSIAIPGIILGTVVLSLIGVLWGLIITGTPFGIMMTGIGIISLAGVVVNNAIVLLDYVKQLRNRGLEVEEALVQAGMIRFRPVILTAITTILGLIPMAVGIAMELRTFWLADALPIPYIRLLLNGQSAGWWGPMAVAVIFGLAFATILTLVMVPTLYSILWDFSRLRRRFTRGGAAAVAGLALVCFGLAPKTSQAMSFDEAWAAAQNHHPQLQQLAEKAKEARIQKMLTWGYMGPNATLHGGYTFNQFEAELNMGEAFEPLAGLFPAGTELDFGEPIVIQPKRFFTGGLSLSQPILNAATAPAIVAANRNVRATDWEVERDVQRVKAQTAGAYYQLLATREAETLSQNAEKLATAQQALAQRQLDAGAEPRRTLLQAELRKSQAGRQVLAATEQRIQAENAFEVATGLTSPEELQWGDAPADWPSSLEDALSRATTHRKDLAATALKVEVAKLNTTVMKLNWLPRIDGKFDLIYSENTGFVDEPFFWTAGIQASLPLWDGGAKLAQVRRAASQSRLAEVALDQTRKSLTHDVRSAWAAHQTAQEAYSAVERELTLAQENFDLAQKSYQAGAATWLSVQEAELGLAQTQFNQLNARVALKMAEINVLVAIGTY